MRSAFISQSVTVTETIALSYFFGERIRGNGVVFLSDVVINVAYYS